MVLLPTSTFFYIIYQVTGYSVAINVVLWVFDIFNVCFKAFKVPVVLGEKGENK